MTGWQDSGGAICEDIERWGSFFRRRWPEGLLIAAVWSGIAYFSDVIVASLLCLFLTLLAALSASDG